MSMGSIKPRFEPTITWGHLLTFLGLVIPALVFWSNFVGEARMMRSDITRHEGMISKITDTISRINDTQTLALQNQSVMAQQLKDHIDWARPSRSQSKP